MSQVCKPKIHLLPDLICSFSSFEI